MPEKFQYVFLDGGSFDGHVAPAPLPPQALRLGARDGDNEWTELYVYSLGEQRHHRHHGDIAVMTFLERSPG